MGLPPRIDLNDRVALKWGVDKENDDPLAEHNATAIGQRGLVEEMGA